jgi:hypothetical protein
MALCKLCLCSQPLTWRRNVPSKRKEALKQRHVSDGLNPQQTLCVNFKFRLIRFNLFCKKVNLQQGTVVGGSVYRYGITGRVQLKCDGTR